MKSSLIYIICILIQFINGFGLLLGVFLDPVALLQPFFEEDLTTYVEADFLIFWTQGIVDVTAAHMIGAGLLLLVLRSFRLENRVNKQVFAAFGAFHGCALLVALYNHLFLGGGSPPFIGVLLIIQGGVLLYGWKKAID